ncbi:MAG: bifunctional aldolase/short-chain dehydrogenase [Gemmatimonadales bacterium]
MKSLWSDADAPAPADPLALRVYTSRLLGREPDLVLHGGGNTSVKTTGRNLYGEEERVIWVKGSGWDLATIEPAGFAPVRLAALERLSTLEHLSDTDMVREQRIAMLDPAAPAPSIEAILHAIIPFEYVDHTHADAVVTISNTPDGARRIREIYGDRVLVVPYVMPGFVLARAVGELTRGIDWKTLDGIILLNHGVFTFADDARESYERMIRLVSRAEEYLDAAGAGKPPAEKQTPASSDITLALARLRRAVSERAGQALVATIDRSPEATALAARPDAAALATGPLTPDHVIRTRPWPLVAADDLDPAVEAWAERYRAYFEKHHHEGERMLDPAPRWVVWPGVGIVSLGRSVIEAGIVGDIARHTARAILQARALGGWRPLAEPDLFAIEYWELEQAKLRKAGGRPLFQGRIALVTGAASGIGRATADALAEAGAAVVGLDVSPEVKDGVGRGRLGIICDLTDPAAVRRAIGQAVERFGGLDLLVSNAGVFPPSRRLEAMDRETWDRSLAVNLSSHQYVLQAALPYLQLGREPAVVFVGSRNVPAPGPGAGAYSVAKAGLTQLARVAVLECSGHGIRVNLVHPHQVFDTGAWTDEKIADRAGQYGMTVEEYRNNNLLRTTITSDDVARTILALLGPAFARTTGAQVPVDGGNERVV